MIDIVLAACAVGVLTGVILVNRNPPENALIGLNLATVCAISALLIIQQNWEIGFSKDIAFFLVFPGAIGIIVFSRFLLEVKRD